jgi:shikimate kinase
LSARWIALTGYMGAGKSTVGRRLAARLGCTFTDADRVVEERAGMPIPDIFARRGEVWFRRTEEDVVREALAGPAGVIALGGGALGSARTRDLLARTAWVAWLRLAPEAAWERVGGSEHRPLAQDRDRFLRRAAQREPAYREAADIEVDAAEPPEEVAERIAAWAGQRGAREAG